MKLSIGILSYNTREDLKECLSSIIKHTKDIDYEIVVVDNASSDESAAMVKREFPEVRLIKNTKNKFYTGGYNDAIEASIGEYFLMLNSDTYLENNAFKKMIKFMEKKNIVACEGLEVRPNGGFIDTGCLFRSPLTDFYELSIVGKKIANKKLLNKIRMKFKDRKLTFQVDVGCNAFFCIKRTVLDEIGRYDDKLLLYYSEDDISKRIIAKGYKNYHYGGSYVIHKVAKSTSQLGWRRIDIFYKDMLYYHLKYNNKISAHLLYWWLSFEKFLWKYLRRAENI